MSSRIAYLVFLHWSAKNMATKFKGCASLAFHTSVDDTPVCSKQI